MILKSKRLIIREVSIKDAEAVAGLINNLELSKWLSPVPYPYTLKDAKWWINNCKRDRRKKERTTYALLIELADSKEVVGAVGFERVDRFSGNAELGYWLGQEYWRKGIMTEAVKAVLAFAFKKLKLKRVYSNIFQDNIPSINLCRGLGFQHEGTLRKAVRARSTGKLHDCSVHALLQEEWNSRPRI